MGGRGAEGRGADLRASPGAVVGPDVRQLISSV